MRALALVAAVAALQTPAAGHAQAALRVQPLTVDVASPAQASSVTLQNNGREELSLQLRVFKWSKSEGGDRLVPTDEVVASPPVARIAPGSNYTIRLARTAGAAKPRTEEAYRLWIDELPPAQLVRTAGGQVDVRLRLDLPVYFRGTGTAPRVSSNAATGSAPLLAGGHARVVTGTYGGEAGPAVARGD